MEHDPMEIGERGTPGMFKTEKEGSQGMFGVQGWGYKDVPAVLLTPGNEDNYGLGRLGRDCVCS
jgi:hypothetical protein